MDRLTKSEWLADLYSGLQAAPSQGWSAPSHAGRPVASVLSGGIQWPPPGPMRVPKKHGQRSRQVGAGFRPGVRAVAVTGSVQTERLTKLRQRAATLTRMVNDWTNKYQQAFERQRADMLAIVHDQDSTIDDAPGQPENRSALMFCALDLLKIYAELIQGSSASDLFRRRQIIHLQHEIGRLIRCDYFGLRAKEAWLSGGCALVVIPQHKDYYCGNEWRFRTEGPQYPYTMPCDAGLLPEAGGLSREDARIRSLFTGSASHSLDELQALLVVVTQFYRVSAQVLARRYEQKSRASSSFSSKLINWARLVVASDSHIPSAYLDTQELQGIQGRCNYYFARQLQFVETLLSALPGTDPEQLRLLQQRSKALQVLAEYEQDSGKMQG